MQAPTKRISFSRMMRTIVGVLVLTLMLPAPAAADPLKDGVAAARRGDGATALNLLRPLAEQGDSRAQAILGIMFSEGEGVPQNYAEAARWYLLAADQGDSIAQLNLSIMYEEGHGVPQSYVEAARWRRLAADQGSIRAQNYLGTMYRDGQGLPQNYVLAHMWFNLAAARATITEQRDPAVKNRDDVARLMTPAQIAEAQKLAAEWKPK